MDTLEKEASLICARLLRRGYIKKNEIPQLELNERLRRAVQERFQQTGVQLVSNSSSLYYAVRFLPEVQESFETTDSFGLKANEIAMLVVLWCKLILPKRLSLGNASATPTMPKEATVKPNPVEQPSNGNGKDEEDDLPGANKYFVKVEELFAEFKSQFASRNFFSTTLSRLSNLKFIRIRDEIISEGILLDLLIDGNQMAMEIKRSALAYKIAGLGEDEELDEEGETEILDEEPANIEVGTTESTDTRKPVDNSISTGKA